MELSDADVHEILRLIDESDAVEIRVEVGGFQVHVRRQGTAAEPVPAQTSAPSASSTTAPAPAGKLHDVTSPLLGVFYRAQAPGAAPYVEVGSEVDPGTVLCLVEVMKMMNAVTPDVYGRIVEICAENAEMVEAGQVLFRVELA